MPTGHEIKPHFIVVFENDPALKGKFFQVMTKEGSDYETGRTTGTVEFSTVSRGSSSDWAGVKVIDPDTDQMAWYEWYVTDGMEYQMKLKTGTSRFGPARERSIGVITKEKSGPHFHNPKFAFWLTEDWYPAVQAKNITPISRTPKVFFEGFLFRIAEVTDKQRVEAIKASSKYSVIVLGGVSE